MFLLATTATQTHKKMAKALININKSFQRSTSLESDYLSNDVVSNFIISNLGIETLGRIVSGASSPKGNKSWSIIGPYGSGKSSFSAFLTSYLSVDDVSKAAQRKINKFWPNQAKAIQKERRSLGRGLLPVPITCERSPLNLVLLKGLRKALEGNASTSGKKPKIFHEIDRAINEVNASHTLLDSSVISIFNSAITYLHKSKSDSQKDGICLILDEFGKCLEWAAQSSSMNSSDNNDIYLLQKLAEAAGRTTAGKFILMTVQHQGIEEYAESLTLKQQKEWHKISGRFEIVPYLESPQHLVHLISNAIHLAKNAPKKWLKKSENVVSEAAKITSQKLPVSALQSCFPLCPSVAMMLGPLFRRDIGQNERSLFSFLSSNEPNGFSSFIDGITTSGAPPHFAITNLYDYLTTSLKSSILKSQDSRAWATAEEAIRRLPKSSSAIHVDIIKSITLLTLAGESVGLKADTKTIEFCVGASKAKIKGAVKDLQNDSILVYREFKGAFQLWDGSDIDPQQCLANARKHVIAQGDVAKHVQAFADVPPLIATKHYLETGTLRSLECSFASDGLGVDLTQYEGDHDGVLILGFPDSSQEIISKSKVNRSKSEKPVLYFQIAKDTELFESMVNLLAARHVFVAVKGLESDPIAQRIFNDYKNEADHKFHKELSNVFAGRYKGNWHLNGKSIAAGAPSSIASQCLSLAYADCPHIHNELINRSKVSVAISKARRNLLGRMVTNFEEKDLGIEKYPPELSIYQSVLLEHGLHKEVNGELGFVSPPVESPLGKIWDFFNEQLEGTLGNAINLSDLFDEIAKPPFGIRRGLAPVLFFSYYLTKRDSVFLYIDGSFIPAIREHEINMLLTQPKYISVQKMSTDSGHDGILSVYHKGLEMKASVKPTLINIVRDLVTRINPLDNYSKSVTSGDMLSPATPVIRGHILSARNPLKLLFENIPEAFEKEGQKLTASNVKNMMAELESCQARLLEKITEASSVALNLPISPFSRWKDRWATWAELNVVFGTVQPLCRIVSAAQGAIDGKFTEGDSSEWWPLFATRVSGKPTTKWDNNDFINFKSILSEASRQLLTAEASSGGNVVTTIMGPDCRGETFVSDPEMLAAPAMASLLNAAEKIANQTGISPEQLFALAAYHSTSKKQKTTT
jgi:hypothetical protein